MRTLSECALHSVMNFEDGISEEAEVMMALGEECLPSSAKRGILMSTFSGAHFMMESLAFPTC